MDAKVPKLLRAESTVVRCWECRRWLDRYPTFLGEPEGYDCECERCTSLLVTRGRPFGPKSRQWQRIVDEFHELFASIHTADWDTVKTDPPMSEVDWEAQKQTITFWLGISPGSITLGGE